MIAIRMGEQPNPRITMRNVLNTRDLSVVVLLDLSESTNETMVSAGSPSVTSKINLRFSFCLCKCVPACLRAENAFLVKIITLWWIMLKNFPSSCRYFLRV
jgi:hypothetical protein